MSLGSVKLNFELDEHDNPIECVIYEHKDANRLIEEFMLLANMSVAQKISSAFPEQALLRRHAPPIERRLVCLYNLMIKNVFKKLFLFTYVFYIFIFQNDFVEHASRLGYDFDVITAGTLQRSFNAIKDDTVRDVCYLYFVKII